MMDITELFKSASVEGQEKVAAETTVQPEGLDKLASELDAAGRLMASALFDTLQTKLAGSGVSAAGGGDGVNGPVKSKWHAKARALAVLFGEKTTPGDDTSVRAEDGGYKGGARDTALSGAKGTVNPQKNLG